MKLPAFLRPRPICWGGLDISLQGISSFILVFPEGEGVRVKCRFWIPRESLPNFKEVPIWKSLHVTDGSDYDQIIKDITEEKQYLKLKAVAFDRWGAAGMIRALDKRRIKVHLVGQGFTSMTQPMKEFSRLQTTGKFYCDDPVLFWMKTNLATRQDVAGNVKPDRGRSVGEIGGMVALFMAIGLWNSPT